MADQLSIHQYLQVGDVMGAYASYLLAHPDDMKDATASFAWSVSENERTGEKVDEEAVPWYSRGVQILTEISQEARFDSGLGEKPPFDLNLEEFILGDNPAVLPLVAISEVYSQTLDEPETFPRLARETFPRLARLMGWSIFEDAKEKLLHQMFDEFKRALLQKKIQVSEIEPLLDQAMQAWESDGVAPFLKENPDTPKRLIPILKFVEYVNNILVRGTSPEMFPLHKEITDLVNEKIFFNEGLSHRDLLSLLEDLMGSIPESITSEGGDDSDA